MFLLSDMDECVIDIFRPLPVVINDVYKSFLRFCVSGHILTVQSSQVCAVQEADCAVQVAKLFCPKEENH